MKKVGRKANPNCRSTELRPLSSGGIPLTDHRAGIRVAATRLSTRRPPCRMGQLHSFFVARLFRGVDVPVLDGEVARVIRATDTARRVGDDAEPLLAILTPSADGAVFPLCSHDPIPRRTYFPAAVWALPYLDPDLKSRKLTRYPGTAEAADRGALRPLRLSGNPRGPIPPVCPSRRACWSGSRDPGG